MNFNKRLAVTCCFFIAACVCYLIGYTPGFKAFFLLGACLETVFWIRVFNRRQKINQRLNRLQEAGTES